MAEFIPGRDEIEEGIITYEVSPPHNELTDADKKTNAIKEALNSDPNAFLNVSRQSVGGNSPMEFVGRFPADKYDFGELQSYLKENFGGGDYRVMLYAKGKVAANKLISIANEKKGGEMNNDSAIALVLRQMNENNRLITDFLRNQQTAAQPSRMEMLQEMMVMKELFSGGSSGNSGNMLGMMRDFMALQNEMRGMIHPEEKEEGFGALLEKATPLLTTALGMQNNAQPQHQNQHQKNNGQQEQMQFMIKMGIKQLLNAAAKNADAGNYASMIIDQFPQPVINGIISNDASIDRLSAIEPAVKNYAPWFVELREHVKAQLGMPSTVAHLYDDDDGDTIHPSADNQVNEDDSTISDACD